MNNSKVRMFAAAAAAALSLAASGAAFDLDYTAARTAPDPRVTMSVAGSAKGEKLDDGVLRQVAMPTSLAPSLDGVLQVGDELDVALFDDRTMTLVLAEQTPSTDGVASFLATAEGYDGELMAVVVQMDGRIQIDIQDFLEQRVYSVLSSEERTVVREMDPHSLPIVDEPSEQVPSRKGSAVRSAAPTVESADPPPVSDNGEVRTVDVLIAYDTDAATWAKSNGGISGFAETQVQKMNTAIANTGLTSYFRFKLAGVYEIGYSANGDIGDALHAAQGQLATLDGHSWSGLRAKRDELEADIVCVLVDNGSSTGTTGKGYSLTDEDDDFSEWAYNVSLIRAVNQGYTMVHEIGHNMGAGHATAQKSSPGPQLYDWSAGYYFKVGSTSYHTIMAYNNDGYGNYYTSVPYFSSPLHKYNSVAVGDSTHDNTKTLKQTFEKTAKYRGGVESSALGTATETESYTWETSEMYPWIRITSPTKDGVDAARSASESTISWMRTRVTGPATMSFYYMLRTYMGSFEVTCDGTTLFSKKDEDVWNSSMTWTMVNNLSIPSGTHVVKFTYTRASTFYTGSWGDGVGVDQISFSGGTPATDTYTVTYKPGANGTGSQQTATKTKNVALTLKGAIFTRTGYTQTGWATSDGGAKAYNLSASYTANASITLYPYWTPRTYTVTLDMQSGSGGTASVTATYGSAMPPITKPTRTSFTFGGYFTATGGGGTQYYTATGASARNWDKTSATTLYAYWTAVSTAPANDSFSSPTAISGSSGTKSGSNAGATKESSEPTPSAQSSVGASVWYKWTAPSAGTATFDTIGSGFDTILAVYTGTALSSLSEVASDDDTGGSRTSKLTFQAVAGTTYRIAVYGYSSNTGSFTLNWNLVAPTTYTVTYKPGANGTGSQQTATKTKDVALTLKGAIFTRTGYTQTGWATSDGGSKAYNLSASYTANAAVTLYPFWTANTYTVTLNKQSGSGGTASVTATYGSAMPSITLPTRTGFTFGGYFTSTGGGGTQYYTATGASARNWDKTSATTLYAKWTASSTVPANDSFSSPATISGASGSTTGSNAGATMQSSEPTPSAQSTVGASVWYKWTAPASGMATFDTIGSGFDTILAVYTGTALSSLSEVASDDDNGGSGNTSKLTFHAAAGTTYRIAVYGYSTSTGSIALKWSLSGASGPANDSFASSMTISGESGTKTGSSAEATMESSEPKPSAQSIVGASIWFKWTAPGTGTASFDTVGSGYDTVLGVYAGAALSSLSEVASDDDSGDSRTSKLTFHAVEGTTYRIAIYGYSDETGAYTLNWSLAVEGGGSGGSGGTPSGGSGGACLAVPAVTSPWTAKKAVTMNGALYDGECNVVGVVQLKVAKPNAKKGTAKVTGYVMLLDGKKKSMKGVTASVPAYGPIEISGAVKGLGTLTAKIGDGGFTGSVGGYVALTTGVGGNWTKSGASVLVDFAGGDALPSGTILSFLPLGETVTPSAGKWAFRKAASIKLKDGALVGADDAAKPNLSGLKLTYTPRTGVFKGSFKIYAVQGGKLKKLTVKVNGVVVDGVGYGQAVLKAPAAKWDVRVE